MPSGISHALPAERVVKVNLIDSELSGQAKSIAISKRDLHMCQQAADMDMTYMYLSVPKARGYAISEALPIARQVHPRSLV